MSGLGHVGDGVGEPKSRLAPLSSRGRIVDFRPASAAALVHRAKVHFPLLLHRPEQRDRAGPADLREAEHPLGDGEASLPPCGRRNRAPERSHALPELPFGAAFEVVEGGAREIHAPILY